MPRHDVKATARLSRFRSACAPVGLVLLALLVPLALSALAVAWAITNPGP
jgi:hypothetical protein